MAKNHKIAQFNKSNKVIYFMQDKYTIEIKIYNGNCIELTFIKKSCSVY